MNRTALDYARNFGIIHVMAKDLDDKTNVIFKNPRGHVVGTLARLEQDDVGAESTLTLVEPIWEMQPHISETAEDYAKFLIYASIEPAKRTYIEAYRIHSGRDITETKRSRSSNLFPKIGKTFLWDERASAWDIFKLRQIQTDWIHRDNRRREEDYDVADLLRQLARNALDGLDPDMITANQAARFLELASKLQNQAVPRARLEKNEIKDLMASLPEDRRKSIVAILIAKSNE